MSYPRDITNVRFGRLVVLHRVPYSKTNGTKWRCRCDCGNEKDVLRSNLVNQNTQSCSCLNKEVVSGRNRSKHNMTASHFYKIWANMKYRCNNKQSAAYSNYGGRGISVCDKWDDFEGFKDEMYESYLEHSLQHSQSQTTLDRIDENKNYQLSNCRWATKKEQGEHRRTNITTIVDGVRYNSLCELARKYDLPERWVCSRYKRGYRDKELIDKELYEKNRKKFGPHKKLVTEE